MDCPATSEGEVPPRRSFADRGGVLIRATPIRRGATAPFGLRIEVIDIGKLTAREAIPYVAHAAFDSRATARNKSSGQADLRPIAP
jgi:hypothetical protein